MKEPWIRVVKKAELGKRETLILRLEAIVLALVAGGFFILLIGQNPFVIYQTIVTGALRSEMAIQATVKIMIPLLIASLGVTLAFKMKFWNIGAEGQIIMGGIFASYFALFHANWNHWLLVIVMFLAGAIGGGLWGLIPAWFKTRYDTNETLFTLMLNYIALNVIVFLREGAWRDPGSQGYAKIARFNKNAALDKVFGIQFGWVIALILVVVIAVYLNRSKQGYEISVVGAGDSPLCRNECKKSGSADDVSVRRCLRHRRHGAGDRFGCHADDGSCRRCRIYGDHRGMAGTVESAGDSAGYLFVQCAGKRKQRSSVFIRIVLGLRGCAAGNHPVLHSGM